MRRAGQATKLSDKEIIDVIITAIKQRKDLLAEQLQRVTVMTLQRRKGRGRDISGDIVPPEMSEDDIKAEVKKAIAETGAVSPEGYGQGDEGADAEGGGKADGAVVNRLVKELIGSN